MRLRRRTFLEFSVGAVLASAMHACSPAPESTEEVAASRDSEGGANSENPGKISIGFWPIAAGLPLYMGVETGIFKDAGLEVEAVKFASAQQVAEAIIAGRLQGSANGTASGALAIAEIASPGLFQIFATNPSNAEYVLDEFIVAKDSPVASIADLKGQKVGSGPGPQNLTITKAILERNGVTDAEVVQLEINQHVAAIESGQIAAAYTLEPTGTVGRLKGITRVLEAGVVAKYILGDPMAPWSGGSATLSTQFIETYPETTKTYIAAYRKAIEQIRANPDAARPYLEGYTAIEGDLTKEVPLPAYLMYDEFTPSDLEYFQKFYDFMTEEGIFTKTVDVAALMYNES